MDSWLCPESTRPGVTGSAAFSPHPQEEQEEQEEQAQQEEQELAEPYQPYEAEVSM
jgi:hypothetical protein